MAPNRKKKKPLGNPSRGFATSSMPSKSKASDGVLEDMLDLPNGELSSPDAEISHDPPDRLIQESIEEPARQLYQLSPEELERQLEESDLQCMLEKDGEKSKRDSTRLFGRLQTERRTLRPLSTCLTTQSWLPTEIMEHVIDLFRLQDPNPITGPEDRKSESTFSEDELIIRLWTLKQTLCKLGFSQEKITIAIRQPLIKDRNVRHPSSTAGKDLIWGLEDCLDWLASTSESEEMPPYQTPSGKNLNTQFRLLPPGWVALGQGLSFCLSYMEHRAKNTGYTVAQLTYNR